MPSKDPQKTRKSQFTETLTSVLPRAQYQALPPEEALLIRSERETASERFFHRNFSSCSLPANLYDHTGERQVESLITAEDVTGGNSTGFPDRLRMPQQSAGGCAFAVEEETLFFLYDRIDRWPDAPDHLALVAVRIDRERIVALATDAPPHARLTRSEYLLLAHLLSGLDLKGAAEAVGASYDTKRKQIQVIMDKVGVKTQTALLRSLSVDITARLLDELLPSWQQSHETALIRRQFGKDVILNRITIGEGIEIPVWEFGARHGRPVLYFHSMLSPTVFRQDMPALLKQAGLRWFVVPRHFLGFDGTLDAQTRMTRLTRALAETVDYLSDEPMICLGESAGVSWAVHFSRHYPELVAHLVLAATPQPAPPPSATNQLTIYGELSQRLRRDARVTAGLARVYNAIARVPALAHKGLAHMYRKSPADSTCIEELMRQQVFTDWLRLIADQATHNSIDEMQILQRNWTEDLKALNCGMTFFHGRQDPLSPIEEIRALADAAPQASFKTFEDAGHLILTEHFDSIVAHMASLPQRAA